MPPNDDADPYIGPASKKIGKNLAVHSVLERSASLEFRLFGSSDLDGLAGTWVAAGRCCTVRHGESTKTDNTNLAAALQSAFDAGKSASTARPASALVRPEESATAAIRSFLFMGTPNI